MPRPVSDCTKDVLPEPRVPGANRPCRRRCEPNRGCPGPNEDWTENVLSDTEMWGSGPAEWGPAAGPPSPLLRGRGWTTCLPPRPAPPRPPARPGTAPVPPAEPARIGPAWRGRGAPCSTSPPPAACSAPCQVPGMPTRGAGAGGLTEGCRRSRRGGKRSGRTAVEAAPGHGFLCPLVGLREKGLESPPTRAPPPGSSAPGLLPELGRNAPGPGSHRPGGGAGEAARGCSGVSRVSPALRAAARPPVPALPIQGSCRPRCSRRRSRPGSPPARRDPERMCGKRSTDPGGARPPALRAPCLPPGSRGCLRAPLLSFPSREPRTKPELCRLSQHDGTRALCLRGEGQDGWSCLGWSRSQIAAPSRLSRAVFRL